MGCTICPEWKRWIAKKTCVFSLAYHYCVLTLCYCVLKGQLQFTFYPPCSIAVVGSYLIDTSLKSQLNVDVSIEIPPGTIKEKDLRNHYYSDKRVLYLAVVARMTDTFNPRYSEFDHTESLKSLSKEIANIEFHPFRGDVSKPYLKIYPMVLPLRSVSFVALRSSSSEFKEIYDIGLPFLANVTLQDKKTAPNSKQYQQPTSHSFLQ